jgi:hypothetical protein
VLTVETAEPTAGAVHYVVRLTWENDGHPAVDATLTATPVTADGTSLTPVPLAALDADGRYEATVTFPEPGPWTVRLTSVTPTATMEVTAQVASAANTPSTTVATTAPPTTAAPTTTAAAAGDDSRGDAAGDTGDTGDDGSSAGALIAFGGLAVLVAVVAVSVVRARRAAVSR